MGKRKQNQPFIETKQYKDPPAEIGDIFYGMKLDEEQKVFANSIWSSEYDIIFCNSKAGTGKTTIATGVANLLVKYGFFRNIVYVMSPYGEETQGFLPGTIEEKSSVYFEPFYQAMVTCNINPYTALISGNMENQKNGTGYITCITDTFLRGQNLNDAVVILDEAQNYTASQLKKILTRIGGKAKVIVIGHDKQCDLLEKDSSGFTRYVEHFYGQERAAFCTLVNNHRGWISQFADELPTALGAGCSTASGTG